MWLTKPPTRLFWRRGWQLFFAPSRLLRNVTHLAALFVTNIVAQRFIEKRSPLRWAAHWCLFWGCILAAAVTFPLSFGWIHFETAAASQDVYQAFVFGLHVFTFRLHSLMAPLVFNVLDISAALVLLGVFSRCGGAPGPRGAGVQQFGADLLPLVMLFAVSVTGVFLTVSTHLMQGLHFVFPVPAACRDRHLHLLYLPFGKFFHIFQRPAQLGVAFYREAGQHTGQAACARCRQPFASRMHIEDLKTVQRELGIDFVLGHDGHYQDVCPSCRRKNLAVTQDRLWNRGA
jgi:hypothetical protein